MGLVIATLIIVAAYVGYHASQEKVVEAHTEPIELESFGKTTQKSVIQSIKTGQDISLF